jgi:hypothetical protein
VRGLISGGFARGNALQSSSFGAFELLTSAQDRSAEAFLGMSGMRYDFAPLCSRFAGKKIGSASGILDIHRQNWLGMQSTYLQDIDVFLVVEIV